MRKRLLLVFASCLCLMTAWSQRTVTGQVTNESGGALPNVSIVIKGTRQGTVTDMDGKYSIVVPANAKTLVFSSIDMETQEVALTSSPTLSVSLTSRTKTIDEVLVVAYGTTKKGEYTGSSAQINAKDIQNRPLSNVTNALVGAAPGIQTTTPGGQPGNSPAIRLRGFTSYSGANSPLIVVDGVPYDAGLANINPDDVASISVLKDASTSALYGSRGANGVILITTKKGSKNRSQLTFKVAQGFTSRAVPEYDQVGPGDFYVLMWESYRNTLVSQSAVPIADAGRIATGTLPRNSNGLQIYGTNTFNDVYQQLGRYNPFVGVPNNAIVDSTGKLNPNATSLKYGDDLDWFDAFYRNGARSDYNLSYSGGTAKSDFYGSFGYTNEKGFVERSDLRRFTGRLSVNTQATDWFRTGLNISGAQIYSNFPAEASIVNPFSFSRSMGPIYPVFAHDPNTGEYLLDVFGNKIYDIGNIAGVGARPLNQGRHAIYENKLNQAKWKRSNLSGRGYVEVTFRPWLKAITNISIDVQDYQELGYENPIVGDGAPAGRASRTIEKNTSYTFNQLLNYNQRFGQHNISAMAGHENYDFEYNYFYGFKIDQGFQDGNTEFGNFATISNLLSRTDRARIESYLSKVSYDYGGRYFITGSLRRDGNSRFHKDVRWDNFWSVGAAWRLDQEKFINIPWMNQMKLRASYGKVGNDGGIGYYPYQGLYGLGFNNGAAFGIVQTALANNELTWETAKSLDVGVDFSLFKDRLSGSIEYFDRVTDGLIFGVGQPLSSGGTTSGGFVVYQNVGSMYNKGLEIQLSGMPIRNQDFSWTVTINATTFKNKITRMPDTQKEIIDGTKKLMEGHSIYDYYLRHFYGVDPSDGAALYTYNVWSATNCRIFTNKDGGLDTVTTAISNAKLRYVDGKSAIPDWYGSIGNSFRYKNVELSFLFTYQIGGWAYDNGYAGLMHSGVYANGLHVDALKRWQKPGDVTTVPRMENARNTDFGAASDRWLISATHLSLNNVQLAYNIPVRWLDKINSSNARIYISAENVYLFAKRKGLLVNQNFNGTNANTYPPSRVVTAGVSVTF